MCTGLFLQALSPRSALCKTRNQGVRRDARGKKTKARPVAKKEDGIYRGTVQLPQTQFDLRANSQKREPQLQKFWADESIHETLFAERQGQEVFTLHDGPPYANGDLHIGTHAGSRGWLERL